MGYSNSLGISVVTNRPHILRRFLFADSCLDILEKSKEYYTLLINFQSFSDEEVEEFIEKLDVRGINYRYCRTETQKPEIPGHILFNKIRNDAASLMECDYYMLIDDDCTFEPARTSGCHKGKLFSDYIIAILSYLYRNPKCGAVVSKSLRVLHDSDNIGYSSKGIKNRVNNYHGGMIVKRVEPIGLFNDYETTLVGAGEEKLVALKAYHNGLYSIEALVNMKHAKNGELLLKEQLESETFQKIRVKEYGAVVYKWDSNKVRFSEKGIDTYIRRFNPKYSGYGKYNVYTYKDYLSRGGIELYDAEGSVIQYLESANYSKDVLNSIIDKSRGEE